MNFRASFCDPFKAGMIEIGNIEKDKIMELFEKTPWPEYLAKMQGACESDIHHSPSLEVENMDNRHGRFIDGKNVVPAAKPGRTKTHGSKCKKKI